MSSKSEYFDAIRPYMNEDAKRVLEQQIPVIRKQVEENIDAFVTSYAKAVKAEADKLLEASVQELERDHSRIKRDLDALVKTAGSTALEDRAAELKNDLDAYEKKYRQLGAGVQKAALAALKTAAASAGIPVGLLG